MSASSSTMSQSRLRPIVAPSAAPAGAALGHEQARRVGRCAAPRRLLRARALRCCRSSSRHALRPAPAAGAAPGASSLRPAGRTSCAWMPNSPSASRSSVWNSITGLADQDQLLAAGVLEQVGAQLVDHLVLDALVALAVLRRQPDRRTRWARTRARPTSCGARPSPARACARVPPGAPPSGRGGRRCPRRGRRSWSRGS